MKSNNHSSYEMVNDSNQFGNSPQYRLPSNRPTPRNNKKFTKCIVCMSRFGYYLPFAITHLLILFLFFMYVFTYVIHLIMQTSYWTAQYSRAERDKGIAYLVIVCWLVFWLQFSLARAVVTNPGRVPSNAENIDFDLDDEEDEQTEQSDDDQSNTDQSQSNDNRRVQIEEGQEGEQQSKQKKSNEHSSEQSTPPRNPRQSLGNEQEEDSKDEESLFLESKQYEGTPSHTSSNHQQNQQVQQINQDIGQGQQLRGRGVRFQNERGTHSSNRSGRRSSQPRQSSSGYQSSEKRLLFRALEKDKDGYNRFCKFCLQSKPDRTHHCKVCGACILKMDHHCPWILNCVGYFNYKYFLMLLFYAGTAGMFIGVTYIENLFHAANNKENGFFYIYSIFIAQFLALVLAVVLLSFFIFHICCLVIPGFTTIQFCQKRNDPTSVFSHYSPYNVGCKQNFTKIMGKNCLVWFFPFECKGERSELDGLEFKVNARYKKEYLDDE